MNFKKLFSWAKFIEEQLLLFQLQCLIKMEIQMFDISAQNVVLDYKIVSILGIFNSIWHIVGNDILQEAGIVWQYIRLPQSNSEQSISYFGGYLSLIGCSQMLIFLYLLLFYCRKANKSKHLFTLRFVICIITIGISLAVLGMVITKIIQYAQQNQSKSEMEYALVMFVNIMDIIVTIYTTPSYIYISVSHYRQLQQVNATQHQSPIDTERPINNQNEGDKQF